MGGLQVVYLSDADYQRLVRLKKRLGLNKSDVVAVCMRNLEDALELIDRARAGVGVNGGDGDGC
jgi:hypothetical protein